MSVVLIIQTLYNVRRDHDIDLDHQNALVNKTTDECTIQIRFSTFSACGYPSEYNCSVQEIIMIIISRRDDSNVHPSRKHAYIILTPLSPTFI